MKIIIEPHDTHTYKATHSLRGVEQARAYGDSKEAALGRLILDIKSKGRVRLSIVVKQ